MQYKKRNAHKMFNVFLFTLCVAGVRGVEEVPRTMTANGELIGTTYQTYSGREVKAFYRVPFAKPPINELRFEVSLSIRVCIEMSFNLKLRVIAVTDAKLTSA